MALGAPLLIWDFREGTGTTVNDRSAGTPANVTLTPGASGAWDTSGGANKTGYNFGGTATGLTALLTSTKVQTALAASKTCTLEFVIDSAASSSTYDEYFKLQDGSGNGIVGITVNHAQGGLLMSASEGSSPNDCSLKYAIATSGIIIGHFTVNTATATATDRPKLYIAGTRVTPTVVDQISLNAALDQGVNWSSVRAYFGEAGAVIKGKIRYLALYAGEGTATECANNATALAANDDADPNASTGNTMTVAATSPVATSAAALTSTDSLAVAATSPVATSAAALASKDSLAIAATSPVATSAASMLSVQSIMTIAATSPVATSAAALASTDRLTVAATSPVATSLATLTVPITLTMAIAAVSPVATMFAQLGVLPTQTLRPPFTATVDPAAMSVVPGAQQLTVAVDARSSTVDADT